MTRTDQPLGAPIALPAVGSDITLGGTVDIPADKDDNGQLDADYDYWVFETAGPALLRVKADGIGGASSGFMVVNVDEGAALLRAGIANTSDMAERDLFLPRAGVWALVATDAMNLLGDVPVGGPTFGYFITVENRAIPTPTAVQPAPTSVRTIRSVARSGRSLHMNGRARSPRRSCSTASRRPGRSPTSPTSSTASA